MKTLAELEAKQALEREKLAAEIRIRESLPAAAGEPHSVFLYGPGAEPWVKYEAKGPREALAIIRAFGELDFVSARDAGCLSIARSDNHSAGYPEESERWEIPQAIELRQHGGKGFYVASLLAHPVTPRVRVEVEMSAFPWAFRDRMHASYTREGDVATARFEPAAILQGQETERVKFAGGSRDAFDYRRFFSGPDHFEDVLRLLPEGADHA